MGMFTLHVHSNDDAKCWAWRNFQQWCWYNTALPAIASANSPVKSHCVLIRSLLLSFFLCIKTFYKIACCPVPHAGHVTVRIGPLLSSQSLHKVTKHGFLLILCYSIFWLIAVCRLLLCLLSSIPFFALTGIKNFYSRLKYAKWMLK